MKENIIVLDLDGTLVGSNIDWDLVREKVRRILGVGKDVHLKPLATMVMRFKGLGWRFKEALRIIEETELESIGSARYPRGISRLLGELRACGYKLVLVTLRSWRTTKPLLDRIGISGLFDLVVTRDDVADRLSQLTLVLEKLDADKDKVVFIGDTNVDLEAGKNLGIKTIIVRSHTETIEKLKELLNKCVKKKTVLFPKH